MRHIGCHTTRNLGLKERRNTEDYLQLAQKEDFKRALFARFIENTDRNEEQEEQEQEESNESDRGNSN